jgi:hypothetical protein
MITIDKWREKDDDEASYEVEADDGWVNATQETKHGKDVFAAMAPADALRLASALILAAEEAKKHKRWAKTSNTAS